MTMEDRETRAVSRGLPLAERVERVAHGVYAVPSQSQPGELHLVSDLTVLGVGEGLQCDCIASEMYRRPCAHVSAVHLRRQHVARRTTARRS